MPAPTATEQFTLPPEPEAVTEEFIIPPVTKETEAETQPVTEAPTTAPTQATEPETTAAPSGPAIVITKHPTGETVTPGGKTWFVAHADNADNVTWEFVAPDGTIYTPLQTMEQNPGLKLDVSKGDTVEVASIPMSMNGWAAQARFTGPGGSAVTDAAVITLRKSEGAYDPVIEKYRQAKLSDATGYSGAAEAGVSEMIYYASHVGYLRMDLDGNGVDELLIAGIGYNIPDEPYLYEIYTLQDGNPVSVYCATARSRIFLMKDNRIYAEGSGGAYNDFFGVRQLAGSQLFFQEGFYTSQDPQNPDGILYFYTTTNEYGDEAQSANDTSMDEKVAQAMISNWRGAVTLPAPTLIG